MSSVEVGFPRVGPRARWPHDARLRAVGITFLASTVMLLAWRFGLSTTGGDIAAQDAWAEFARLHPGSAYNLSWYGGMHPVSYSVISPYLMALIGVRTTLVLASIGAATLTALLLIQLPMVKHPLWPSLAAAVAMTGNAISGRVTFALGIMFALAALGAVVAWPDSWQLDHRRRRLVQGVVAVVMATLSTFGSPVAGFFLGLVAAALWLCRHRRAAYVLGVPPVLVVILSAVVFPFGGKQPMHWSSAILPILLAVFVWLVTPPAWRVVRLTALIYIVAVLFAWLVPSPIGTNVVRLSLVFGTSALLVPLCAGVDRNPFAFLRWVPRRFFIVCAILTSLIWQGAVASVDYVHERPDAAWRYDINALLHQFAIRGAKLGRVEVVPSRSHRESSALAPYANLARGWNRQADLERNPVFYDTKNPLDADSYRAWLDRWAVHYVVLPPGEPDTAAKSEDALVRGGLPYLKLVWSNQDWKLYRVQDPTPLVEPPAIVTSFTATEIVVTVPSKTTVMLRVPASPWLSVVDLRGHAVPAPQSKGDDQAPVNVYGCLTALHEPVVEGQPTDVWTVLHAPSAGTYRIAAPYKLPRGTTCPDDLANP
ncbi:MFS transporter [Nocardioides sp. BP30]|uniref:MFS transporter n=1 Tax=Nocardioides sp. BP30 TaxID=3036374 RepID=UPI0024684459|nr:MFS transporter [Nocardioides sp. BP30]WGL52111.1 MFS transporter [Nocardioides sp. BP30]